MNLQSLSLPPSVGWCLSSISVCLSGWGWGGGLCLGWQDQAGTRDSGFEDHICLPSSQVGNAGMQGVPASGAP